jgi:hypothetical protein
VASWAVLLGGLLLTFAAYQWAVIHRRPGEWLPGIGEALIGIAATAVGSFGTGLTALLRRERRSWAALLPFLAGLGTILYCAWNLVTRH